MRKTTLLVMAAGMGSRFGGLKQATAITLDGRGILDFSCYDAKNAGFDDIVFIVREEILGEFKERIGNRIARMLPVTYVIQKAQEMPEGRKKPFGTAHAVLCAKDVIHNPFCIINADDYYGPNGFKKMHEHLLNAKAGEDAMVYYELGKTLSPNGSVSRGICALSEDGFLKNVEECYNIDSKGHCEFHGEKSLPLSTPVSMNLWGLTEDIFPVLEREYLHFLKSADLLKDEFVLPSVIQHEIDSGKASVKAYPSKDQWYGITYQSDLPLVKEKIQALILEGVYPKTIEEEM